MSDEAVASVEAQIAAEDVALEMHMNAPDVNERLYVECVTRRARALARWQEARAAGDWAMATQLMLEVLDANEVAAAAAAGMVDQAKRFAPRPLPGTYVLVLTDWP